MARHSEPGARGAGRRGDAAITPVGMLPAREVADLFGVTLRTLWNWDRLGILVPHRIRGRRYYALADIDALAGRAV